MSKKKLLHISEIVDLLKDRRPSVVAEACGVTYAQVLRIASGKAKMINVDLHEKLSNYLQRAL